MLHGDESGLFWYTPPRVPRYEGRTAPIFDARRIGVESDWSPPCEYPELEGPVAFDVETEDPDIHGIGPSWCFPDRGKVVGVAVATATQTWYFPTQHEGGGNLGHNQTMSWLGSQLKKPTVTPIFANAPYDLGWLCEREGLKITNKPHDIQVMMTLLDEHRLQYSLDSIARDLLGQHKDESLLTEAVAQALGLTEPKTRLIKQNLYKLPSRYVGYYAEQDPRLTYDIWEVLYGRLQKEELLELYDLEQVMTTLSVKMRAKGIRTDPDKAEQIREELIKKEEELIQEVHLHTKVKVDAWDNEAIGRALRAEGHVPETTSQGRDSIRKEWLASLDTPVARAIGQIRIYNKARTTFIDGHILGHARNGRIHCQWHQLRGEGEEGGGRGTITGRWSSSDPNLQQIPKRNKEIQRLVRTLFLPEEGEHWAALDYSSQEPRLTVHFAALASVKGGKEAMEQYIGNPRTDYHQMVADFCGIDRESAKPINLGITYGMKGAKLCRSLGLPTAWCTVQRVNGRTVWTEVNRDEFNGSGDLVEVAGTEGKELLKKYHAGAPFVQGMIDLATSRGSRRGYLITLLGRRTRFARNPRTNQLMEIHAALNKLIQGSAADQTKQAMRLLYESHGIVPLITMHDELGLSVSSYSEARMAANAMETAVQLKVPSVVDVKLGPNWGSVVEADPVPSMGNGRSEC